MILATLIIFGIHATTREGMIFHSFKMWIASKIEKILSRKNDFYEAEKKTAFILKPLFDCPACMASIWGTVIYFTLNPDYHYLVFIFGLAGLNYLISRFI